MARTVLILGAVAVLAGCGSAASSGKLDVVASTNVYGDIARQIGGVHVAVTSVLSDPNADPHLFEPGTSNGLAVARARVVIENGLDYDSFMTRLERAAPSAGRQVVSAADAARVHGTETNPHLWYDLLAVVRTGDAIEGAFARADPKHAAAYKNGLQTFDGTLAPLAFAIEQIRLAHAGEPVAYTEPVPGYLIEAAGLRNLAPPSFTRAIEQGTEPTASAVSALMTLVVKRRVRVLLYNKQAVSPITARIRTAAQAAGIPVVGVTETLPPNTTFQRWQLGQVKALRKALGG